MKRASHLVAKSLTTVVVLVALYLLNNEGVKLGRVPGGAEIEGGGLGRDKTI